MDHRQHRTLIPPALIALTFLALSLAWGMIVPPYENLDEIEHVEVIRYIAVTGQLPAHGVVEEAGYHVRQEASQPPLYHLLGAAWMRLWRLPTSSPEATPVPGAVVACGPTETLYNKTTWARDPLADTFPWERHRRAVHGLRVLSALLQTATVMGAWFLARRLFPRGPVAALTTALIAFNPQFLLISAGVNNDNLVTPLATWALVLLLHIWEDGPSPKRLLCFGALAGLAGLSKLSGLGLLGLGGLALLVYVWRRRLPFTRLVGWGLLMGLPALGLLAPWMARNLALYGDPTALAPMLEKVGRRTGPLNFWGILRLMTLSYWGQLPCAFYPRALYWPFLTLLGGGAFGLLRGIRTLSTRQREGLALCALWLGIIIAAWIRWEHITPATGGRLLFPASAALALLLAAGWERLGRALSRLWAAALPIAALLTLWHGPLAAFAPPRLLPPDAPIPHRLDYTFGEGLHLRGYNTELHAPHPLCRINPASDCQTTLDVTLYWEATAPITTDWTLALQLVSPQPGATELRLNYNGWPGHGNLPTSAWPTARLIRDRYRLLLPDATAPTQAWTLHVALFDLESRMRLPVRIGESPVGAQAPLTTLRVPGTVPDCPITEALPEAVHFGEQIALTHAQAVSAGEDTWEVQLCWEALALPASEYTVFVHAYAADGTLLGTGDGPPQAGAYPTRLWQPGDRIVDRHTLTATERPATIAIGLYHPESGERLAAFSSAMHLPNDAVVIWEP